MVDYVKVSKAEYEAYPGRKSASGVGDEMTYGVETAAERPVGEKARQLADRIQAALDELGLSDDLAQGGIMCGLAIEALASAAVAVVDEGVPQYARRSVLSLARAVEKNAEQAQTWSVGAGNGSDTLRQIRESAEAPALPSP